MDQNTRAGHCHALFLLASLFSKDGYRSIAKVAPSVYSQSAAHTIMRSNPEIYMQCQTLGFGHEICAIQCESSERHVLNYTLQNTFIESPRWRGEYIER